MSTQQAPAGWYTMPDGTRRYWDGEAWGMTEQEAWEASGPVATSLPIEPRTWTREDQQYAVDRAQESAWGWSCAGLLISPLAIGGIVKNSQARRMGEPYGIEVGYGPAIMAWVILAIAVVVGGFVFFASLTVAS